MIDIRKNELIELDIILQGARAKGLKFIQQENGSFEFVGDSQIAKVANDMLHQRSLNFSIKAARRFARWAKENQDTCL
jgi:hypothetical protein